MVIKKQCKIEKKRGHGKEKALHLLEIQCFFMDSSFCKIKLLNNF